MMQLCRQFENACNQAYMQGNIRGFMHLDNGQETIPALIADSIKNGDIKYSYYREVRATRGSLVWRAWGRRLGTPASACAHARPRCPCGEAPA